MVTINLITDTYNNGGRTRSCRLIITTTRKLPCTKVEVYLKGKEHKSVTLDLPEAADHSRTTRFINRNIYYKDYDAKGSITNKLVVTESRCPKYIPKGTYIIPIEINLPDNLPNSTKGGEETKQDKYNIARVTKRIYYSLKVKLVGSGIFSDFKKDFTLGVDTSTMLMAQKFLKKRGVDPATAKRELKQAKKRLEKLGVSPVTDDAILYATSQIYLNNATSRRNMIKKNELITGKIVQQQYHHGVDDK